LSRTCCPSIRRKVFPNLAVRVKIERPPPDVMSGLLRRPIRQQARGGKSPPIPNPGRRATRRRPMGSAPTGASARRVDACLSRCAARALFAATVALPLLASNVAAAPRAVVLDIDGAIGPAVADYVARELRGIGQSDTRLVILRMNTPGGLDTSMRTIIRAILS